MVRPRDPNDIIGPEGFGDEGWVAASTAAAAATNLGLGTGDSPQFAGVNLGHASDTTLARVSAGVMSVEGSKVMTVGNDGTGSLFDADLLDGYEASAFALLAGASTRGRSIGMADRIRTTKSWVLGEKAIVSGSGSTSSRAMCRCAGRAGAGRRPGVLGL